MITFVKSERSREDIIKDIAECDNRNYNKDRYSNPYERELTRFDHREELLKYFNLEEYGEGLVSFKTKKRQTVIISLKTLKWRVKGKSKWYYGNLPMFIEKFA